MGNYFEYKSSQKAILNHEISLYRKFCRTVLVEKSVEITEEELAGYNLARADDDKDYRFRKMLYGPCLVGSFLMFDSFVTIPNTANNKVRGIWNLVVGLPVAAAFSLVLVFHKEQLKSHQYAFQLCGKYGVDLGPDEISSDDQ
jgi:hypothetical protein